MEASCVLRRDFEHAHALAADAAVDQEVLRQQVGTLGQSLAELGAYNKITGLILVVFFLQLLRVVCERA